MILLICGWWSYEKLHQLRNLIVASARFLFLPLHRTHIVHLSLSLYYEQILGYTWSNHSPLMALLKSMSMEGDFPTKSKYNRALGRWVSTQRSNKKRMETGNPPNQGRTDQEEAERRIRRLNAIGFTWSLLPGGTTTEVDDEEENSNRETYSSLVRETERR